MVICPSMITLAKPIPSHINVFGHRVLESYDGQTIMYCDSDHLYQVRPGPRRLLEEAPISTPIS
jgi:hypothetical protein